MIYLFQTEFFIISSILFPKKMANVKVACIHCTILKFFVEMKHSTWTYKMMKKETEENYLNWKSSSLENCFECFFIIQLALVLISNSYKEAGIHVFILRGWIQF